MKAAAEEMTQHEPSRVSECEEDETKLAAVRHLCSRLV